MIRSARNIALIELREVLRNCRGPHLLSFFDMTADDYLSIDDEDWKVEFLDGELIVHSAETLTHEELTAFLCMVVGDHASRFKLGHVLGSNVVMQLSPDRYFSPDLSYLSFAHTSRIQDERVVGPMDLVVEILAKRTRRYDRGEKLAAYQEGRVPEIWLIDPDEKRFEGYVLRDGGYERIEMSAGRWTSVALAGFSLPVEWFWRKPLPTLDECRAEIGPVKPTS